MLAPEPTSNPILPRPDLIDEDRHSRPLLTLGTSRYSLSASSTFDMVGSSSPTMKWTGILPSSVDLGVTLPTRGTRRDGRAWDAGIWGSNATQTKT